MKRLYLIRHGRVAVPQGLCYGRSNVSLAEPAEKLAHALRKKLPENFTLWSSPLARCRQLAERLGEPCVDARLMEMDFGDWEMCPYESIDRQQIDAWAADPLGFSPPNGESVTRMQTRVLNALDTLLAESEQDDVVIVSHAGPIRVIWGRLCAQPPEAWLYKPVGYGEMLPVQTDMAS